MTRLSKDETESLAKSYFDEDGRCNCGMPGCNIYAYWAPLAQDQTCRCDIKDLLLQGHDKGCPEAKKHD